MSDASTPVPLSAVLDKVRDVEGWMSPDQAAALYTAAAACPADGQIVEIGSFHGRSTIVLASAAPTGAAVVAIEPHAGNDRGPHEYEGYEAEAQSDHEAFLANLAAAGVSERVRHVRTWSHDALGEVDGDIDVLYIDGAHRYSPARRDIVDWAPRVADGGTLLIHDSFSSLGLTLAILRELVFGRRFRYVGRARSLAIYRADLGRHERGANARRQLAQLPWFLRNLLLKAALKLGLGKVMRRLGRKAPDWPY